LDHAARVERLRALANREGLDGVLVFSWRRAVVAWFSGYRPGFVTNQASLWIPADGQPVLGVRFPYDAMRASGDGLFELRPGADPASLPPAGATIGLVASDLAVDERSATLMAALAGRHITSTDLGPVVDGWRAIKDEDEIAEIRRATEIGALALEAAGAHPVAGEGDLEIAARVEAEARRRGAFRAGCLGGVGDGAVVTEASGRIAGAADPIGLELTLETPLGCTQVNATLWPSPARDCDERADRACRATRRVLVESIRPGVDVDEVVAAGDSILAEHGLLADKEYDFGHGIGLETPELPRLVSGLGKRIEAGMTIAVHVAVRRAGAETAFIGGPVVVRPHGAEELVRDASWISSGG
jgi:Xaa-Pro aminopeptidase